MLPESLTIQALLVAYRAGTLTPDDVVDTLLDRINADADRNAWIRVLTRAELSPYLAALAETTPEHKPLYGIPFAIKDNLSLIHISEPTRPTT